MEIIKQDAGVPLPVAYQVAIIYAGVNGFLDSIPAPGSVNSSKGCLKIWNPVTGDLSGFSTRKKN